MSTPETSGGRIRAYLQFIAAVCYFFLARSLARHGAQGLVSQDWSPLVEQAMLVFLLLLGYAAFGSWMDRQAHPVSAQGLPRRPGWPGEVGLGLAVGWSIAVVCVLPMMVAGGIAIVLSTPSLILGLAAWPMQPSLRCWRWAKRLPFAAMDFNALLTRWGRSERRSGLRRSMPLCRPLCPGRATPASPFPWRSAWCFPPLICARALCG